MSVARYHQAKKVQEALRSASKSDVKLIILPSHPLKRWWDMWIIFLVLYNAVVLPLDVGFDVQTGGAW